MARAAAITSHPVVVTLARLSIGAVFRVAALAKIGDPATFSLQIHRFHMMPVAAENVVAVTLPWIELLAALALVVQVRPRAGAAVALVLMVVFTVAVGAAWARKLDIECGCFGKAVPSRVGAQKLAENVGLTVLAALALQRRRPSEPAPAAETAVVPTS